MPETIRVNNMSKNEVDDFLDGLNNEVQENPFEQTPSEDPFKIADKEEGEVVEKEEKPIPFHKDPKLQRYIEKELDKRLASIKPTETERFTRETSSNEADNLTDILTRIIGNDTPERIAAVKDFRKELSTLEERGAQRALQEIQQLSQEDQRAEQEAQEELAQAFDDIEENFDVDLTSNSANARKTRNDFIDFVKRVSPKDRDGEVIDYPDFQETFALFKETQKPQSNDRAKALASRSLSRSSDASRAPVSTDNSWKAVDKLLSKLQ